METILRNTTEGTWFDILDEMCKRRYMTNKNYSLLKKGYRSKQGIFGSFECLLPDFVAKLIEKKENKDLYILVSSHDWLLSNGHSMINSIFRNLIKTNDLDVKSIEKPPKNWHLRFQSSSADVEGSITILFPENLWKKGENVLDKDGIYYVYPSDSYTIDKFFSDALYSNVFLGHIPQIFIIRTVIEDCLSACQVFERKFVDKGWKTDFFSTPIFLVKKVYDLRELDLEKNLP